MNESLNAAGQALPTRVVVKLGTSTLCDPAGSPDARFLGDIAAQIGTLQRSGGECVIVTSGAIRAGLDLLTLPHTPRSIPVKQAAAAVGQGQLMRLYADAFASVGITVGQILLTRDDFHERRRYVHAANTLRALLRLGVVPIVNENDTIAVEEIRVGDNDMLAALVAGLIDADLLILLSDIDGLYSAVPNRDRSATLIRSVTNPAAIESVIGGASSEWGTGGMRTKIEAAELCMQSGIPMTIANGRTPGVIGDAIRAGVGTQFEPQSNGDMPARKRWIAGGRRVSGQLQVHEAACAQLLHSGRSLLPAGILALDGKFAAGSVVELVDRDGKPFARGIVNHGHEALRQIMGLKTSAVRELFGQNTPDEVIHRDNLVILRRTADLPAGAKEATRGDAGQ